MPTAQRPIRSGFGAHTTAREALGGRELRGAIAIVTGGYSGLGVETTRALAGAGATVIVPARAPEKARAALSGIAGVELEAMDLADPASIAAFAKRFISSGRPLDILVNNAAIMACPLTRNARGFESHLAVNHIGHFDLTARVWPALRKARGARVVNVSSAGYVFASVDLEDPHFERRPYDKFLAYGQSKTANILFTVGLDARTEVHGVRAFAVHPGKILTPLARHLSDDELRAAGALDEHGGIPADKAHEFKTMEQGAATTVWCAANSQLDGIGGVYCEDVDVAEVVPADAAGFIGIRAWAIDPATADRLWTQSEAWIGGAFAV